MEFNAKQLSFPLNKQFYFFSHKQQIENTFLANIYLIDLNSRSTYLEYKIDDLM